VDRSRAEHGAAVERMEGRRDLADPWRHVVNAIALAMAAFYLYTSVAGQFGPQYHRGIFVMAVVMMIFLLYPASARSPRHRPSVVDLVLALLTVLSIGYWIVEYTELVYRVGDYLPVDFWVGVVGLLVCLEAGRRVTGWLILVLGGLAISYGLLGGYIPGVFAHRGFTIPIPLHPGAVRYWRDQGFTVPDVRP
jgi:TRAP-type uncharacterized transport system fused permease subunit